MSSPADRDLAGLAALAQRRAREIRPYLLSLHARAFASAPLHDRRSIKTFETLACGLIPLVDDSELAEAAAILSDCRHVPAAVTRMVEDRLLRTDPAADFPTRAASPLLSRAAVAELVALGRPDVDLALARNGAVALDGIVLELLIARSVAAPTLARALLDRPETKLHHRVALFRHADEAGRDAIRRALEDALPRPAKPKATASDSRRARFIRLAETGDVPRLLAELGKALRIEPAPVWRLGDPGEAELFALALIAAGLEREDFGRILLTADAELARSVRFVFRLAQVCRSTGRHVAEHLVGAGSAPRGKRPPAKAEESESAPMPKSRPRKKDAGTSPRAAAATAPSEPRPARSRAGSGRPGRRSPATTSPDRT